MTDLLTSRRRLPPSQKRRRRLSQQREMEQEVESLRDQKRELETSLAIERAARAGFFREEHRAVGPEPENAEDVKILRDGRCHVHV